MSIRKIGNIVLLPLSLIFMLGLFIFTIPDTTHASTTEQATMPHPHTTILTTPVPIDLPIPIFIIGNSDGSPIEVIPGQKFTTMVMIHDLSEQNLLATTTTEIRYDDSLFRPLSCSADPDREFNLGQCNQWFQSDAIRFNVTSLFGISHNVNIAEIEWEVLDVPGGGSTLLELDIRTSARPDGSHIDYRVQNQVIHIPGKPLVSIGNQNGSVIKVATEKTFELPIQVFDISDNPITVADLAVTYDSSLMEPIACENYPKSSFDDIACDFDSEPGIIRLSGAAQPNGIYGDVGLASITWYLFGPPDSKTTIGIDTETLLDPHGNPITSYATKNQTIDVILENIPNVLIGNRDSSTVRVMAGDTFTLPIEILEISSYDPVGGVSIELDYDDKLLKPTDCENHPNADFAKVKCNLDFDQDAIRLNGVSKVGVSGDVGLVVIEWEATREGGGHTTLSPYPLEVIDTAGNMINAIYQQQMIHITPLGDVNCDDRLGIVDGLFILQYDIEMRGGSEQCGQDKKPVETLYQPACDVNSDRKCDSIDALFVLQCDVGFTNSLCPTNNLSANPEVTILESTNLQNRFAAAKLYVEYPTITTGGTFTATVMVDSQEHIGALTASLGYDTSQFRAIACQMVKGTEGHSGQCNLNAGQNRIHFNTAMPAGASGSRHLVNITFEHIGTTVDMSAFTPDVSTLANAQGQRLPFTIGKDAMIYLPIVQQ